MNIKTITCILFCILNSPFWGIAGANWDQVREVNELSFNLINSDVKRAQEINDSLLNALKGPIPLDVQSRLWNVRANIAFFQGDYKLSLASNLKFLDYAEQAKDTSKIFDAVVVLGTINYYTNAYSSAIRYLNNSIELVANSSLPESLTASPLNTLGSIYKSINKLDSALLSYKKALNVLGEDTSTTSKFSKAVSYANLGDLYFLQKDFPKAIEYLKLGIEANQNINRNSGWAWCSNKLGELYLHQNELEQAFQYLQLADSIGKLSATEELQKDNKYFLLKYYLKKNGMDEVLAYLSEYHLLSDSIVTKKTKQNIRESQTKYEVEKKEAALALSEEQKARAEAEKETKQYYLYWSLTGIAGLLIVLFFGYRYYRNQQKLANLELEIKDSKLDELLSDQESKTYASILRGQEKERERIAQDLHDRLGGTLAALKHTLRKPENKIDPEDLKIVDQAVLEVRGIAHNLSTGLVSKYGLGEALGQLFRAIEKTGGIRFSLYIHPKISNLGQAVGMELYRIVQELVSNTLKHAEATEVSLQTNFDIGSFNFIFEDNGKGFELSKAKGGIGLENIKARVNNLGGDLHIDTQPGRGTIVIIELRQST